MRGDDVRTEGLFSGVGCEARVPAKHPLPPIQAICDEALEVLLVKGLAVVVAQAQGRSLLSEDHFSVDGRLIENRNGRVVAAALTVAGGTAERQVALAVPTLFGVGKDTTGLLPVVPEALAAHAPRASVAVMAA